MAPIALWAARRHIAQLYIYLFPNKYLKYTAWFFFIFTQIFIQIKICNIVIHLRAGWSLLTNFQNAIEEKQWEKYISVTKDDLWLYIKTHPSISIQTNQAVPHKEDISRSNTRTCERIIGDQIEPVTSCAASERDAPFCSVFPQKHQNKSIQWSRRWASQLHK